MGLSLETIKQQYNLPKDATLADVMKFAKDNNIDFNLFSTDNAKTNLNNPSGSIYGDNQTQPAAKKTPASTTSASQNKSLNIDFTNQSNLKSSGTSLSSNNNSVFGFGNQNQGQDDESFWGFKSTLSQPTVQNITASGQVKSKDDEFKLKTDFFKNISTEQVNGFLDDAFKKVDERVAKFGNRKVDPENDKVVKIRFTEDGKIEKTLEDGTVKTVELSAEEQKARSEFSKKQRITSVEYVDGKVIETMANGKIRERDAMFGERGYKKDGNSLDEELQSVLGEDYEKAQTKEEKQALIKKYINDVFLKLPKEEREAKAKELLKNTDRSSEAGQYLLSVAGQFGRKIRNEMNTQIIQTRESATAQQDVAQTVVTTALTEPAASSQDQKEGIDDAAEKARDFGIQDHFVEQAAQNISNINDDNAKHVTETAIDMNSSLASKEFAQVTDSAKNTNQALLEAANGDEQLAAKIKEQLQSKVGDLKDAHISVIDDNQVTVCNETSCRMIEMDLLDGDVKSALRRVKELDLKTISNGQAEGIHSAFESKIKDKTIKPSEVKDVADVLINTETIVDDVEKQKQMIDSRIDTTKDADPEIRDAALEAQGRSGHKYQKENQLYADEAARTIDENNAYNRSVADNIQNYDDEDIQGTIGQRVSDSGDEEALNAMARHVYEYSESNRDKFINQLQNSGYDSVKNTLKEAKTNYETQNASKTESKGSGSNVSDLTTEVSSQTQSLQSGFGLSSSIDSATRINNIVSSTIMNTTTKAMQIRNLSAKDQQDAIEQMLKQATTPEIKSLALSGFKTEVIGYLLDNYSSDKREALDSLQPFMNDTESSRYEMLKSVSANPTDVAIQNLNQSKRNFFINH